MGICNLAALWCEAMIVVPLPADLRCTGCKPLLYIDIIHQRDERAHLFQPCDLASPKNIPPSCADRIVPIMGRGQASLHISRNWTADRPP